MTLLLWRFFVLIYFQATWPNYNLDLRSYWQFLSLFFLGVTKSFGRFHSLLNYTKRWIIQAIFITLVLLTGIVVIFSVLLVVAHHLDMDAKVYGSSLGLTNDFKNGTDCSSACDGNNEFEYGECLNHKKGCSYFMQWTSVIHT